MSLSNLISNSKSLLIFLMMLGLCNFASAEQEGFELLSRNPENGSLLYASRYPFVTPDGRYVTFTASETWGGSGKIWLFDRVTNQLELISDLSPKFNQAAPISADGCTAVFTTFETPLKGGLYLRDRCLSTPRTILISDTDNTNAYIDISADGKRLAYSPSSSASDYPMNDREYGVHVLDVESNTSQCISTQQVGNSIFPAGVCRRATTPSISADGSRVVFFSVANLFGSGFDGGIYLYDKNNAPHLSLIQPYSDGATMPSISPDGRYVAFQSYKSLAGEGNEPRSDVFIKGELCTARVISRCG